MPLSVSVTCPDMDTARMLARAALEARLVACANILPGVESHFWWEGNLNHEKEALLILKSTEECRAQLVSLIQTRHPYELPAITWFSDDAPDQVKEWIAQEIGSGG
ncbi:MAG: divalent-cation tolerance protein CutA [Pseudomonadota bacterium]